MNDEENRLIAERRAKLSALRAHGPAFPNGFRRDALAAQLLSSYADRDSAWLETNPVQVRVGGRRRTTGQHETGEAGQAGTFGQQAGAVSITNLHQLAWSTTAGTFKLPGFHLQVGGAPC